MSDTKQIDEVLNILKANDFPSWAHYMALDRRDTSLYILQLVDKYKEETDKCETYDVSKDDLREAEDKIADLESENSDLQGEIDDLESDISDLKKEIKEIEDDNKQLGIELRNQEKEIDELKGEIYNGLRHTSSL